MAGSLLLSNEKMHKILTEPPRPKHDLTLGVPFCSTNGKPVELIQPAQLARRSQVAKHQSASRNKNLAVSQTLSRWLRMHEINGCDRQEEKGPFFPQCSYFLCSWSDCSGEHESSTSMFLYDVPSLSISTTR